MKNLIILIAIIAAGCASTYKPVRLTSLTYSKPQNINDTLRVSYAYNVQESSKNRRYTRKEKAHHMAAVAVMIENTSSTIMTLTKENFKINEAKEILTPKEYSKKVKQRVGAHMLHCLWGPWAMSWETDEKGNTEFHGIYIPAGAIVGIGNALRASNANKDNLSTMENYEIWNRQIAPGKTVYGLVAISCVKEEPLTFSLDGKKAITKEGVIRTDFIITPVKNYSSLKHDFFIVPNEGKSFTANTKINIANEQHYIEIKEGDIKKIIRPTDTKTLSRLTADGTQLLGVPMGNYWLFKIISGKINAYYYLADENTPVFTALQKGTDSILPFTKQTLIDMIDNDLELVRLIKDEEYTTAIKIYNQKDK